MVYRVETIMKHEKVLESIIDQWRDSKRERETFQHIFSRAK